MTMTTKKQKTETEAENVIPLKVVKPSRLDKFKSKRPGTAGLETAPEVLSILKVGDVNDFFRLHPNEEDYWSPEMCFVSVPIKGEKKDRLHIIDEELALRCGLSNKKIKRFRLALATKPHDALFLCQVPSMHLDNQWNSDAVKACVQAMTCWTQVASRKEENPSKEGYKIDRSIDVDPFPEPKWPSSSLEYLIELSFHGAMIETEDDPALHRLLGIKQKMS
jgi:hypothetical protein